MTLHQLAELIGTTPQTVQRLETATMRVSTDWLERFAKAFGVSPQDLIAGTSGKRIQVVRLSEPHDGAGGPGSFDAGELIEIDIPAADPVGGRLRHALGPLRAGSMVVGDRLGEDAWQLAHGRLALVGLNGAGCVIRRIVWHEGDLILLPVEGRAEPEVNVAVDWIAPIVMEIVYY
jgi:transcriptional regulator with XRE-family HTH domain